MKTPTHGSCDRIKAGGERDDILPAVTSLGGFWVTGREEKLVTEHDDTMRPGSRCGKTAVDVLAAGSVRLVRGNLLFCRRSGFSNVTDRRIFLI